MYKNELDPRDKTYLDAAWHRWRVIGIMAIALIPLNALGAAVSGPETVTLFPGEKWESVAYTLSTSNTNTNTARYDLYSGKIENKWVSTIALSSDGRYYGYPIADDVIMYWEGTVGLDGWIGNGPSQDVTKKGPESHLAIKYTSGRASFTRNECYLVSQSANTCEGRLPAGYLWMVATEPRHTFVWSMKYNVNVKVGVYVGPNAAPGTYSVPAVSFYIDENKTEPMMKAGKVKVLPPFECTINTPPKIDFGKVNIWEWEGNTSGTPGGNRRDVLGSIDGNFTINCTGGGADAHAPAKLKLSGTYQTYANDLKMTMDATGEVAPATIRASIKSIYAPCSGSGVYFASPSNEVNLGELTVGQHLIPYRFSLCALGQGFKSGAASASATVTINWE